MNSNLMLFDFSCSVTVKESGKGRGGRAKAILIKIITYHSRIVEFGKQGLGCNKFYVPNIHYIINRMDIFCSINVLIQTKWWSFLVQQRNCYWNQKKIADFVKAKIKLTDRKYGWQIKCHLFTDEFSNQYGIDLLKLSSRILINYLLCINMVDWLVVRPGIDDCLLVW